MLTLSITKRTHPFILGRMEHHYSQPKGFVGRNICYAIHYDSVYYGHIVGGSATKHLPGRHDFLSTDKSQLNNIVNNIFFNVSKVAGKYPTRNFTVAVIDLWTRQIVHDWEAKYGDEVLGFETLIELPRTGELYRRNNWTEVGITKGYTCKRISGVGTDSWSGKRQWNTIDLRPKYVLCKKAVSCRT